MVRSARTNDRGQSFYSARACFFAIVDSSLTIDACFGSLIKFFVSLGSASSSISIAPDVLPDHSARPNRNSQIRCVAGDAVSWILPL